MMSAEDPDEMFLDQLIKEQIGDRNFAESDGVSVEDHFYKDASQFTTKTSDNAKN